MAFLVKNVETVGPTSAVVVCIILGLAAADYGHNYGNHPAAGNIAGAATIVHNKPAPVNPPAPPTGTVKTITTRSSTAPSKLPGWQCSAPIQTMSGGLKYRDCRVGAGATPKTGDTLTVNYTGYLMDGTKFDSSVDRNQPFSFTIGMGQVIKGWDEGVASMKVGGKRKLIIPPALAYGDEGTPGGPIPPHATLVFDVRLLRAHG